jgi:hypothetical protein
MPFLVYQKLLDVLDGNGASDATEAISAAVNGFRKLYKKVI